MSVVIATYPPRHAFHKMALECFRCQRYGPSELVVLDTGGARSPVFGNLRDERVRYVHDPADELSLGQKRTRLVELARGEFVAHFDDDNVYQPASRRALRKGAQP